MKIICAIGSLGGGGAERVMVWLVNNLALKGHQVTLLIMNSEVVERYECIPDVKIVRLNRKRFFSSRLSFYINLVRWRNLLRSICIESKADVVLSFIDAINIYCLFSLLGMSTPVVVAERTNPAYSLISLGKKLVRPFIYRVKAHTVVFQTAAVAEKYKAKWHLKNCKVISNAVQETLIPIRSNFPEKIVLSVGRLDYQKGHDVLLHAWSELGNSRDGWKLRIVGDGIERGNYEKLLKKLGIQDSVQLIGFSSDVASEYQKASVVVLPSRVEGFPNVLLEAMAAGKSAIASDLPEACREVIQDGTNGLLYNGNSVRDLVLKLQVTLSDKRLMSKLSANAVKVKETYSEQAIFSLWEQCLKDASFENITL